MADIEAGRVKVVLVYKLERILRSTFEWSRFSQFLEERGCRLLSPSEDLSDASASGKLKTNILMSFAEYERLNVVEKIRSKMHAQARRGMWGGGYIPFGYSYDREKQELHPNHGEAPIVRRIFQRAAELISVNEIARELNSEGLTTGIRWMRNSSRERHSVGQKQFRPETLTKLIANPLYRGVVRFGGDEFKGQHEALVSAETWETANAAVAEAKRNQPARLRNQDKYRNMLKGLAYCAASGAVLYSGASGKPGDGEKRYRYYTCSRRRGADHTCLLGSIAAQPLEATVIGFLSRMATDAGTLETLCGSSASMPVARRRTEAELAKVTDELAQNAKQISNCVDAIATDGASVITEELAQRIAELRASKQNGLVRRAQLQQKLRAVDVARLDRERVHYAAERLGRLLPLSDLSRQMALVRGLVTRVDVHGCINNEARDERGRMVHLNLSLRVDRLVEMMERDVVIDEREDPTMPFAGRAIEFEVRAIFRPRGHVEVIAPFRMSIGDDARAEARSPLPDAIRHPIHRATRWQTQLPGASVRSIASMERVSPSLVSLHLKLLRLAPEIQIFARELTTRRGVHHFSLRRLASIADLDHQRQLLEFTSLRNDFS
jgi:DNA invertase Pin-like site-specific DNA recombinase